jgi:anti-sigma28 factor (negative regulator of flagellin synthesis)
MSSSRKNRERVALVPVGWTGWDDARAEQIRERILRGEYNTDHVADRVARRLLASGAV